MAEPTKPVLREGLARYEELRQAMLKRASLPPDSEYNLHEAMAHAGFDMKRNAVELLMATVMDDFATLLKEENVDER